jgi:hypothetical protein
LVWEASPLQAREQNRWPSSRRLLGTLNSTRHRSQVSVTRRLDPARWQALEQNRDVPAFEGTTW